MSRGKLFRNGCAAERSHVPTSCSGSLFFSGLTLDQTLERVPDAADPVVAFRKMGARKTTEAHIVRAQKMGRLLAPVVPYLPFDELVAPPVLKDPRLTYDYVERVAAAVRAEIGLKPPDVLDFEHLIRRFRDLQGRADSRAPGCARQARERSAYPPA